MWGARPSSSLVAKCRRVSGGSRLAGATPRARGIMVRDPKDPTACKVTQQLLRCRTAPDPSSPLLATGDAVARSPLTPEPSCKDEARIGQKNKITRRWAQRGTPPAPRDQRTRSAYIFGAICPAQRIAAGLVLPRCNTAAMSLHLAEISRTVTPGAHAVLLLDQARLAPFGQARWALIGLTSRSPFPVSGRSLTTAGL
jgi:hypothetical protein